MSPEVTRLCKCFCESWMPGAKVSQQNVTLCKRWLTLFTSPVSGFNVLAEHMTVHMHRHACMHLHSQSHARVCCKSLFFPLLYMRKYLWWQPLLFGTCETFLGFPKKWKHNKPHFFSSFKANKYSNFLKPLKSVAKYWEHKEVSEKWYEWQYGSTAPVPTQALLSADRLTSFKL